MAMAKETGMRGGMCSCPHHKTFGWIFLIAGIVFLLRDWGIWDFWNIQWWTVLFIFIGLSAFCKCCNKSWC